MKVNVEDYDSPFGKAEGLSKRLKEWSERLGKDGSLPWVGLGLIADLSLASEMLEKDESEIDAW